MKIRPVGKRLLVQPVTADQTTPSGLLVIPDIALKRPNRGVVIALGPDVQAEVLEGNTVVYGEYAGTAVEVEGTKMLLLNEDDVIGVEEPS